MKINNKMKMMKFPPQIMTKSLMKMKRNKLREIQMINPQKKIKVRSKNHHNNRWRPKTMQ